MDYNVNRGILRCTPNCMANDWLSSSIDRLVFEILPEKYKWEDPFKDLCIHIQIPTLKIWDGTTWIELSVLQIMHVYPATGKWSVIGNTAMNHPLPQKAEALVHVVTYWSHLIRLRHAIVLPTTVLWTNFIPDNHKVCHPLCVFKDKLELCVYLSDTTIRWKMYVYLLHKINYMFRPYFHWPSSGW